MKQGGSFGKAKKSEANERDVAGSLGKFLSFISACLRSGRRDELAGVWVYGVWFFSSCACTQRTTRSIYSTSEG